MQLRIDRHGQAHCVYGELIDLAALGSLTIRRGSFVEPDDRGQWTADLSPIGGPHLGPFAHRSQALSAEQSWLEEHWVLVSNVSVRMALSKSRRVRPR
jgi:hypothetical protein